MKTEKVLFVLFLIGFVLKMTHIPGGSLFTVLTLSVLSFLYFPLGFYFLCDKKIDNKTVGFSVISGFLFSTAVLGILFSLMQWPGGKFLLIFGLVTTIPIAFLSYLWYTKPKLEELIPFYKNIFIRAILIIIFGLLLFVL